MLADLDFRLVLRRGPSFGMLSSQPGAGNGKRTGGAEFKSVLPPAVEGLMDTE